MMKERFGTTKICRRLIIVLTTFFCIGNSIYAKAPTWSQIDSIVTDAIKQKAFPGCQVFVLKDGKAIYDNCFGNLTYDKGYPVTSFTIYDLASLSKTSGTLLAIMKLYDEGKLKLTDKASSYLHFFKNTNKENITITDLLFHETGLPPYVSLGKKPVYFEQAEINRLSMQTIARLPLKDNTYVYSCINFMLLKEVVETITQQSMDIYLNNSFYVPMGLNSTSYLPLNTHQIEQIAPTLRKESFQNGILQGLVHDPLAAYVGGVSGNAGLFSTAHEVAAIHQMILDNGVFKSNRYLSAETCQLFTTRTSASGRRGLGYDKPTPSKPTTNLCSPLAPTSVFGHTGYTGTCCWVDPENKLIYVFLSNRTFPDDSVNKLARLSIRPKIQEVIYKMIKK